MSESTSGPAKREMLKAFINVQESQGQDQIQSQNNGQGTRNALSLSGYRDLGEYQNNVFSHEHAAYLNGTH